PRRDRLGDPLDRPADLAIDLLLPLVEAVLGVVDPLAQRREAGPLGHGVVGELRLRRGLLDLDLAVGVFGAVLVLALAGEDVLDAALRLGEPLATALDDVSHRVEREEAALLL